MTGEAESGLLAGRALNREEAGAAFEMALMTDYYRRGSTGQMGYHASSSLTPAKISKCHSISRRRSADDVLMMMARHDALPV